MSTRVAFGVDEVLARPDTLRGRIGLVTNAAARPAADPELASRVALQHGGVRIVRLFSPEHGLNTDAADGAAVEDALDPLTELPVISLYGERQWPSAEQLADLDAVWFDIPDIGARFYTYIWTLFHLLQACAEAGKPLVILDRPNPLSGELSVAEGPLLDMERCASFLGGAAIPIRHSLTAGELALLWNTEGKWKTDVQVIRCSGWKRSMHWPETGLPFVPTSPAMPSYESALLYPGLCLFEGTNLSVGRGTKRPFQVVAAPWLDAKRTIAGWQAQAVRGVAAELDRVVPNQGPYAGESCNAVRLRVTASDEVRPVAAGLQLLAAVMATHRKDFQWAPYPTAVNPSGEDHFDRLIGQPGIRAALEANPGDITRQVAAWTKTPNWRERTASVLLYD